MKYVFLVGLLFIVFFSVVIFANDCPDEEKVCRVWEISTVLSNETKKLDGYDECMSLVEKKRISDECLKELELCSKLNTCLNDKNLNGCSYTEGESDCIECLNELHFDEKCMLDNQQKYNYPSSGPICNAGGTISSDVLNNCTNFIQPIYIEDEKCTNWDCSYTNTIVKVKTEEEIIISTENPITVVDEPVDSNFCFPGLRESVNGVGLYCDKGVWDEQKLDNSQCNNNFECRSNFCSNNLCYDVTSDIRENKSILDQILELLKKIFWFF